MPMKPDQRAEKKQEPHQRVRVACPNCHQGYRITARLLGRRLVCRHCRQEWRATEAASEVAGEARSSDANVAAPLTESSGGDPVSDSTRAVLPEDLPPAAGSSSVVIDTSWVGRQLGRYRIVSILGQGGMGVVWRARDDTLNRDVALKILNQRKGGTSGLNTELFMQEARAVAKLQHPAVVSIFDVGQDEGQVFLALELMERGTLKEYVDRDVKGPVPPRELFELMIGPAKALALAHKRGIIHRDIKPSNLMFDDHGHLKLMDFGLADVAQELASRKMRGKAVGSLGWVAPETVRGEGTTAQSDIYAMGLVMYYALTARPWLHAKSRSKLIALHQNPPELDLSGVKGLTSRAQWMLRKCLATNLADRFQSADELAEALYACAEEDPVAISERRKSYASIAAVAAVFGLLVGTGGVMYYFLDRDAKLNELATPVRWYPITTPQNASPVPFQPESRPPSVSTPDRDLERRFKTIAEAHVPWPQVPYLVNPATFSFVAGKDDKFFHRPDQACGRKILASDLLTFSTFQQAAASARSPCPDCRPTGRVPDVVMGEKKDEGD